MKSAFDIEDGILVVSASDAGNGRLALWPGFVPVPEGWQPVHGPDTRQACLVYAETYTGQVSTHTEEGEQ